MNRNKDGSMNYPNGCPFKPGDRLVCVWTGSNKSVVLGEVYVMTTDSSDSDMINVTDAGGAHLAGVYYRRFVKIHNKF
jgi:hypothetical protein